MADRNQELGQWLGELKLSRMAVHFNEVAVKATREGLTHEAFLYELARLEWEYRQQRRLERQLQYSHLPREKTFKTFQQEGLTPTLRLQIERLRSGRFVAEATNVIAVGPPGAGKSHLLCALGHTLLEQGHSVLWVTTATLVQKLLVAKRDLRLAQELTRLNRISCLILDDIGYVQQSREEMEVLFALLAERYERRSVMITTNLVFSEWERIFKDPLTALAAIDRLVHHSVLLDMTGVASWRARQAQARQNNPTQSPVPQLSSGNPLLEEGDDNFSDNSKQE